MPTDVTVDLRDLRKLVRFLQVCSVESEAQRRLRVKQAGIKPSVVRAYVQAVKDEADQARKEIKPSYAELLAALKDGNDVRRALANFVNREAKSSGASDTKVRQIP